jgi:transcriptional regulator with XRE-family HTH domain
MDVGEVLRQARLARGLTLEQVSAVTRVPEERLYAIERNNVLGMPLVYVRGYVRAFAHEVGLDPDDLTERYIAQFATTTSSAPTTEPFKLENVAILSDAGTTPADSLDDGDDLDLYDGDDIDRPNASEPPRRSTWGPRATQWAVLVLVAVVAAETGFMVGWSRGRHTSTAADDSPSTAAAASVAVESGFEPTKPDPDAERVSVVEPTTSTTTVATNLKGGWTMTNKVEKSELRTFRGLRLVYELELHQNGTDVSGTGRKISENGRALRGAARTPITLSGTVDGDRVHLTFREKGRRRESGGSLEFQRAKDGSLRGTFESDAAKSSGQSIVRRALS